MKRLYLFMLLCATTLLASCTEKSNEPIAVQTVTLNKEILALEVGQTAVLTATVLPEAVVDRSVTWTTNSAAVTVSNTGLVTAVSPSEKPVVVTATSVAAPDKKATCSVTVVVPEVSVASVTLNETTLTLDIGVTYPLVPTIAPADATDKTVTWTTSDPTRVEVSDTGVVTAKVPTTESVTITATSVAAPDKKAMCSVTVKTPVSGDTDMIGYYFYEDGTLLETHNTSKYCIGIVFWQDPENAGHGKIVALDERENIKTWDDALVWASEKTDGGLTWWCPNKEELQYLYCAYVGAAPTTWETEKPTLESDAAAAEKFEKAFLGVGVAMGNRWYWSSSELNDKQAWYINFGSGYTAGYYKTYVRVRPIAAF